MHKYQNNLLPATFETLFVGVNEFHDYNTRRSSNISHSIDLSPNSKCPLSMMVAVCMLLSNEMAGTRAGENMHGE